MEHETVLLRLRRQNGISQEEAAKALGCSQKSLCNWESDDQNVRATPPLPMVRALADLYHVDECELFKALVDAIQAPDNLTQEMPEDRDHHQLEERMQKRRKHAWAKRGGFKKDTKRHCWRRVVGKRHYVSANGCECWFMPSDLFDHGEFWRTSDDRLLIVSHLYDVDEIKQDELAAWCEPKGLAFQVRSSDQSWYYPGHTWMVYVFDASNPPRCLNEEPQCAAWVDDEEGWKLGT